MLWRKLKAVDTYFDFLKKTVSYPPIRLMSADGGQSTLNQELEIKAVSSPARK